MICVAGLIYRTSSTASLAERKYTWCCYSRQTHESKGRPLAVDALGESDHIHQCERDHSVLVDMNTNSCWLREFSLNAFGVANSLLGHVMLFGVNKGDIVVT